MSFYSYQHEKPPAMTYFRPETVWWHVNYYALDSEYKIESQ